MSGRAVGRLGLPGRSPRAAEGRVLPLPFLDAGLGVAAVRFACGFACVTSLSLRQTEMRLREGGHPARQRRPTRAGTGAGAHTKTRRTRPASSGEEGSDLAAGRRDVHDRQPRRTSPASRKAGPGQPPGHRAGPGAARLHWGAVRGHARPARRPDRAQLPDRTRPTRSLVCGRLDALVQALGRAAAVCLAYEPRHEHRRPPHPHLAAQPRPRPAHRGRHQRSPPPRTATPARSLAVRAFARQGLRVPLRTARAPPRRRPAHTGEDRDRDRADPQEPRPARADHSRPERRLRPGLVLRPAAASAGSARARRRSGALLQRQSPPRPAAPGRGSGLDLLTLPSCGAEVSGGSGRGQARVRLAVILRGRFAASGGSRTLITDRPACGGLRLDSAGRAPAVKPPAAASLASLVTAGSPRPALSDETSPPHAWGDPRGRSALSTTERSIDAGLT